MVDSLAYRMQAAGSSAIDALTRNLTDPAPLELFAESLADDELLPLNSPSDSFLLSVSSSGVTVKQPSLKRPRINSAVDALDAIKNILDIRSHLVPSTAPSNEITYTKFAGFLRSKPNDWQNVVKVFHTTRKLCEMSGSWAWHVESPGTMMLRLAPSRGALPPSQAATPSSDGGSRSAKRKGPDATLIAACDKHSACAKFQTGSCDEPGSHGPQRKHVCYACGSADHANATCGGGKRNFKKRRSTPTPSSSSSA